MTYPDPNNVKTIAIIGCGTIGASWAAWFLSRGATVRATDPDRSASASCAPTSRRPGPHFCAMRVASPARLWAG